MSGEPSDDSKVLAEALKLPLAERAAHSNWKVRAEAYDDVKATCARILDASDPWLAGCGKYITAASLHV